MGGGVFTMADRAGLAAPGPGSSDKREDGGEVSLEMDKSSPLNHPKY